MLTHDADNLIAKTIIVELGIERTFQAWVEEIQAWWPSRHSISGDPGTQVFIEGKAGGRFFERASNGTEYEWGVVQVWEPPTRVAFSWYLGSGQTLPTRVEVQFIALSEGKTRVELEHRGPELIGDLWEQRVMIFNASWERILAAFETLLTKLI